MFENVISQSQQFWSGVGSGWAELWREQLERIDAATEEVAKLQEQGTARAEQAIDELATLGKASLEHAQRLSTEWRRVGMEAWMQAWRRGADAMTNPPKAAATEG